MKKTVYGSLMILVLLAGAAPLFAQTDPVLNPDQQPDPGNMPPEKWDVNTPAPIDWNQASNSALHDTFVVKKNFWRASAEVVGLNVLIWGFDRYVREGGTNPGFRIGFNSWQENLTNGFEWDDNNFSTNQFDHPYHGSLYFNAARSNGYSFWESVPFAFGGSFLWEYFFEVHHPSMNDWIATSVGGTALGEVLHRLSLTVRDNTATGASRNWREVGAMAINPMGGLNRLFDGDWGRVHPNPVDQFPRNYHSKMDFGLRTIADEQLWTTDTTRVYMNFEFDYGDIFFGDMEGPYDFFDLDLQLNFSDTKLIGMVDLNGLLGGTFVKESNRAAHIVAGFHHFDYINNSKIEFGAQSLGAGFMSRYETPSGLELRTELHGNGIILGASESDYFSTSGREYDYGPGLSAEFVAGFGRGGWQYLRVAHAQYWIHAVNGNIADHHIGNTSIRMNVPIVNNLGLGLEYRLFTREVQYQDYPDVSERHPELRVTTTWLMN